MSARPTVLQLLALPAVALGFLALFAELHPASGEHVPGRTPEPVSIDARHGEERAHFETSRIVTARHCSACLLRNQTKSLIPDLPVVARGRSVEPLPPAERSGGSRATTDSLLPSRAPPLA